MTKRDNQHTLPEPISIACGGDAAELLAREWLLTNSLGAYASGAIAAANTRRYHGLLIATTQPPVGRIVALSCLMDRLVLPDGQGGRRGIDLSTFEFPDAFGPDCRAGLVEFRQGATVQFIYRLGAVELVKEIILAKNTNAVAIRYSLSGAPGGALSIWPFAALRDFHSLRQEAGAEMTFGQIDGGVRIEDRHSGGRALCVTVGPAGAFHPHGQWWRRFRYRADIARGQEGLEDLYTPGWLDVPLTPEAPVQLTASLDGPVEVNFDATVERKRARLSQAVAALGPDASPTARRLAVAADAFVVSRERPAATPQKTILAGYHWFADWGRDTMIAVSGLLLETGRFHAALEVLRTFAQAVDEGMVPNRFDDYGGAPHFNSIDASLWFVIAADRYVRASGDESAWAGTLGGAVDRILHAYHDGTRFNIHADADGLIAGGDVDTQLTWMDAKCDGEPVTPRYGKCVEINALWHAALRIAAERCEDPDRADFYTAVADRAAKAFTRTFWNDSAGCLYDYVREEEVSDAIRPNQILAVALPHCPLPADKQLAIVEIVRRELLTARGLRTLAPSNRNYRGGYGVTWGQRDRAYHQGMAWPWLMGPFVEAYLKVHDFSATARSQAQQWLAAFDDHITVAGVGYISEIFDGDPPHAPAGCIAQAWSVAELLRAHQLVNRGPD